MTTVKRGRYINGARQSVPAANCLYCVPEADIELMRIKSEQQRRLIVFVRIFMSSLSPLVNCFL